MEGVEGLFNLQDVYSLLTFYTSPELNQSLDHLRETKLTEKYNRLSLIQVL